MSGGDQNGQNTKMIKRSALSTKAGAHASKDYERATLATERSRGGRCSPGAGAALAPELRKKTSVARPEPNEHHRVVGLARGGQKKGVGAKNRANTYQNEVGGEEVFFGRKGSNFTIRTLLQCKPEIS